MTVPTKLVEFARRSALQIQEIMESAGQRLKWSPGHTPSASKGDFPLLNTAQGRAILKPYNPVTGHFYTGGNRAALILWNYERLSHGDTVDPRFIAAQQVEQLAAKSGQRLTLSSSIEPIMILRPVMFEGASSKRREDEMTLEELATLDEPVMVKKKLMRLTDYAVFNGSAIRGLAPFEVPGASSTMPTVAVTETSDGEAHQKVRQFVESLGVKMTDTASKYPCYYPSEDRIELVSRARYKEADSFATTLLHEMYHSTGHSSREGREAIQRGEGHIPFSHDPLYAAEELRASLFSVIAGQMLGITPDLRNEAAYLQGWKTRLEGDDGDQTALMMHQTMIGTLTILDAVDAFLERRQPNLAWWPAIRWDAEAPVVSTPAVLQLTVVGTVPEDVRLLAQTAAQAALAAADVSAPAAYAATDAMTRGGSCDLTALRAWSAALSAAQAVLQEHQVTGRARLEVRDAPTDRIQATAGMGPGVRATSALDMDMSDLDLLAPVSAPLKHSDAAKSSALPIAADLVRERPPANNPLPGSRSALDMGDWSMVG